MEKYTRTGCQVRLAPWRPCRLVLSWLFLMASTDALMDGCHHANMTSDHINPSVTVCPSAPTTLKCCAATNQTEEIRWYFRPRQGNIGADNEWKRLSYHSYILYHMDGRELLLKRPVLGYHSGDFRCEAVGAGGDVQSYTTTLEVVACAPLWNARPKVMEPPDITTFYLSAHASINVTCRGLFGHSLNPENRERVNVSWIKVDANGYNPVKLQEARWDNSTLASILVVKDAAAEDYGQYVCLLVNKWGVANTSVVILSPVTTQPLDWRLPLSVVLTFVTAIICLSVLLYCMLWYSPPKNLCRRLREQLERAGRRPNNNEEDFKYVSTDKVDISGLPSKSSTCF